MGKFGEVWQSVWCDELRDQILGLFLGRQHWYDLGVCYEQCLAQDWLMGQWYPDQLDLGLRFEGESIGRWYDHRFGERRNVHMP